MATVTITITTTPSELLDEARLAVRSAAKAIKHEFDNPTPTLEVLIRGAHSFLDGAVKAMDKPDDGSGGATPPP